MSGFLFPRLPRERARLRIPALRGRTPEDLLSGAELLLDGHTYSPIGGRQVTEEQLSEMLLGATRIAAECGFPDERSDQSKLRFDRRIAGFLHERMAITPNQAADEEIWAHLTVGPFAAFALWRFPGLPDERALGRAPRNTFRRLWWRAEILGQIALDDDWGLLEDETVQIMERTALSANPLVARALADAFRRRVEVSPGVRRMELMRDAMKRVNRLTPFILLESLGPELLPAQLDLIFTDAAAAITRGDVATVRRSGITTFDDGHKVEPVLPLAAVGPKGENTGEISNPLERSDDPSIEDGSFRTTELSQKEADTATAPRIERIPLGLLMKAVVETVTARGTVDDEDLGSALGETCGVEVSKPRERLIRKLAWSARGRHQLEYDEATGCWSAGRVAAGYDERFGTWTFEQVVERATEMLSEGLDPFDRLLVQVAGVERAPRVIASVVGTAINEARNGARV